MFDLTGKTALVTGGGAGLGLAIARRLREAGAWVTIMDRRRDAAEAAAHAGADFIQGDVTDEHDLAAAIEQPAVMHGRLDILVNNAGIQPLGVSFDQLTPELLRQTLDVNVVGPAMGIKLAGRRMAPGGRIVNMASFTALVGAPRAAAYATSKAAVTHMTRLAAVELAPKRITCNCICPGTAQTPAVTDIPGNPELAFIERVSPMGRLIDPAEVAAMTHYLVSDEAASVTGQVIAIDGGATLGWPEHDVVAPSNVVDGRWIDDPVAPSPTPPRSVRVEPGSEPTALSSPRPASTTAGPTLASAP